MKKLLSIVLCIVLTLSVFSLVACGEEKEQESFLPSAEPTSISVFSTAVVEASDTLVKQITATVYPLNAPDKSVDWSVHWNENNIGEDAVVTDYITVEPTSDGALTADVTCHKSFKGSTIIVRVTTRVGGHTADCVVRYIGSPYDMTFELNGINYTSDEVIQLRAGKDNLLKLNTYDFFGNKIDNTYEFEYTFTSAVEKVYGSLYNSDGDLSFDGLFGSITSYDFIYNSPNPMRPMTYTYRATNEKPLISKLVKGYFLIDSTYVASINNEINIYPLSALEDLVVDVELYGSESGTIYTVKNLFAEWTKAEDFGKLLQISIENTNTQTTKTFYFDILPVEPDSVEVESPLEF